MHVVASQAVPDAAFPTVAFPNPEEPGVADALLALAARVDADLAIALDPDADRCALGVPAAGGWRMLSGDETGVLLGDHVLRHGLAGESGDRLVATTVVSSSMLRAVAAAHGARFAETLTGFKWIVRAGPGLVYGYEEALGYCVDPDAVRDKDGIAAAVLACDLAADAQGRRLRPARPARRAGGRPRRARDRGDARSGWRPAARDAVVERLRARPPAGWAADRPAPDVLVLRRARRSGAVDPAVGHRAQAEGVPAGRGARRGRSRGGPGAPRMPACATRAPRSRGMNADPGRSEPLFSGVSLPPVPRPKVHDAALRLRLLECAGRPCRRAASPR